MENKAGRGEETNSIQEMKDARNSGSHSQQIGLEDQRTREEQGPEQDDTPSGPFSDCIAAYEDAAAESSSERQNVAEVTPNLSNRNTPEDQQSLRRDKDEDAEELIILDREHVLTKMNQEALNKLLRKQLEKLDLDLREKREMEKADDNELSEMHMVMYKIQEQLLHLQSKKEERDRSKAEAESQHQQAEDKLQVVKRTHASILSQVIKSRATVSQLEAEVEKLTQQLLYTQELSETLHSDVKAMQNVTRKTEAQKSQAEDEKLKQDLYVERLTKDMEQLTQQIAMHEVQAAAKAMEKQETKSTLAEAEVEMESLVLWRKQLLQQLNSSLMAIRNQDETITAMHEAMHMVKNQEIVLDREIEGYKKSIAEEEERDEMLTMQFNRFQLECDAFRKLILQSQAQQEALQARYTSCVRTLQETARTLTSLRKESSTYETEISHQRRQVEKESAVRLELENKIMAHMQQKLTHTKAAQNSQRRINKIGKLKQEMISKLWQLENEIMAVKLESSEITQRLDSLTITQKDQDQEITKYNKLIAEREAKMSAFSTAIERNQDTIAKYKTKISQIAAVTGSDDLNPLQIKAKNLSAELEELNVTTKRDQQLLMRKQEALMEMIQKIEVNNKLIFKLHTSYTALQQKKSYLESQIDAEQSESAEQEKHISGLRGDLLRLQSLLNKNVVLSQALKQQNTLMERDFIQRLKEAEGECVSLQMKVEESQQEKERLIDCLMEAKQQMMLWEKKLQLIKETRSTVDVHQHNTDQIKTEIHLKKLRISQLLKEQKHLERESVAAVIRLEPLLNRRHELLLNNKTAKCDLTLNNRGLRRKMKKIHQLEAESEKEVNELKELRVMKSEKVAQTAQELEEMKRRQEHQEAEIITLQDTKVKNLACLVALQSRARRLQAVLDGTYRPLSAVESVEDSLQKASGGVYATNTAVRRMCQERPEFQEALHKVSVALAACTENLEKM
ncbi:coiled-coil domain-containing protein 40 [Thalassophryne amazonica]|uniref:coiled-coil domain-containing protein 40 n=1 Tax=Thalassophryne amazonica TaxID=390379 RepID=UPI0014710CF1|nr:coiled-coil domain-containing protein 40 [Thalassophryne amazonica]